MISHQRDSDILEFLKVLLTIGWGWLAWMVVGYDKLMLVRGCHWLLMIVGSG